MKLKKVISTQAPQPIGPYSQALIYKELIFVSGQLPIDIDSNKIVETTIERQTYVVFSHIEAILKAAQVTLEQVIKVEIFLKDIHDFQAVNTIYAEKFCYPIKPTRQCIQAAALPLNSLIEISCIAVRAR